MVDGFTEDGHEMACRDAGGVGPDNSFRVFYRIDSEAREVLILAIGVKKGSVLHSGRSRFEL